MNQEVNAAEHSDFVEAADSSIVLDASARDDAVLATPHGQVTLELVSLCYFSGNHYITVCRDSRVTPPWVCWDALNTSGQCWALDAAPTGSNLLRSSNNEHTWGRRDTDRRLPSTAGRRVWETDPPEPVSLTTHGFMVVTAAMNSLIFCAHAAPGAWCGVEVEDGKRLCRTIYRRKTGVGNGPT